MDWWKRKLQSAKIIYKFGGRNKSEEWFGGEQIRTESWYPTKPSVQRMWRKGAWPVVCFVLGLFFLCFWFVGFFFLSLLFLCVCVCWWWFWGIFLYLVLIALFSWLGLTHFPQKSLTRIKETLIAPEIPSPRGAGHSSSQEVWTHSHFWHFYPYETFIFHIIKLFPFKDPKKVAVPTTQPGVQGLHGWGDIWEHNNNTKSLSKVVRELELPVAISQ